MSPCASISTLDPRSNPFIPARCTSTAGKGLPVTVEEVEVDEDILPLFSRPSTLIHPAILHVCAARNLRPDIEDEESEATGVDALDQPSPQVRWYGEVAPFASTLPLPSFVARNRARSIVHAVPAATPPSPVRPRDITSGAVANTAGTGIVHTMESNTPGGHGVEPTHIDAGEHSGGSNSVRATPRNLRIQLVSRIRENTGRRQARQTAHDVTHPSILPSLIPAERAVEVRQPSPQRTIHSPLLSEPATRLPLFPPAVAARTQTLASSMASTAAPNAAPGVIGATRGERLTFRPGESLPFNAETTIRAFFKRENIADKDSRGRIRGDGAMQESHLEFEQVTSWTGKGRIIG